MLFKLFFFINFQFIWAEKNFCCFSASNNNCATCYPHAKNYGYCSQSFKKCNQCSETAFLCNNNWIEGTWTTGYWDCCKPSCAWKNKGNMNKPVNSCLYNTIVNDTNLKSVCDGGTISSCSFYQPIIVNESLSLGFAAASVSGLYGLLGDINCGECYHLIFDNKIHDNIWGGAHTKLVNKQMIIQIINIGYDIIGEHTFDLQIPGAGQGAFQSGCIKQYLNKKKGDFDCDNPYGGCSNIKGCYRLPVELQKGCFWRYEWYYWLTDNGKTNNPYIKFRRIKCPQQLIALSGSYSLNDEKFEILNI